MTTPRPFALRLFVPSGLPEAGRPGVYVLTGPGPESGMSSANPLGTA
jgi:hypothetical protein